MRTLAPRLRDAVAALPRTQRIVIQAWFFEKQPDRAIADRLGADPALVRRLRSIALASLRSTIGAIEDSK